MQDHDNATYTNLERRTQAALRIQRAWRKKSAIGGRSQLLDTNSRWKDAAVHAQMKLDRLDADKGKNDPRTRWKRSVFLAARIQDTNAPYAKDRSEQEVLAYDKILETQHWLELVDAEVVSSTMAARGHCRQLLQMARPRRRKEPFIGRVPKRTVRGRAYSSNG
ncbi:hypothetical protein BV22DRAFT_202421 [Leucogyrophana mollusca]|uniref:Uncharacterized protein n=1 Tax=Leucogyrophana mollusca TaxID=85980 RepID=A0ACB8BT03_9AGAM|nr:hypothetical protein BV22DRAFT_202421 [Leucogyrophana mollusca]